MVVCFKTVLRCTLTRKKMWLHGSRSSELLAAFTSLPFLRADGQNKNVISPIRHHISASEQRKFVRRGAPVETDGRTSRTREGYDRQYQLQP